MVDLDLKIVNESSIMKKKTPKKYYVVSIRMSKKKCEFVFCKTKKEIDKIMRDALKFNFDASVLL